ncbi:MAG: methylenetetrahydrofolate reductase, partial [Vallitaleaceae bacterium]|nr:methylenetetrahydrofolate reductase [Vallitaleaceae bacterium]
YAAIDPYRDSIKNELVYVKRKLYAGADGFFTQPFFDLRTIEIYHELLENQQVYFGLAPVLSERSKNYWYAKNHVIFPKDFNPDMDWNIGFAKKVLSFCQANGRDVYLMPIRTNIENYLSKVLG